MGFAEQLAAKAAEAKSHREKTVSSGNAGSVGGGRTKVRRPRIRPIDDDDRGVSAGDLIVEGGDRTSARDNSSVSSSDSFAEQLKLRAARGEIEPSAQDAVVHASTCDTTNQHAIVLDKRKQPLDSPQETLDDRAASSTRPPPVPVQTKRGQSERHSESPSVSSGARSGTDARGHLPHNEVNLQMSQANRTLVGAPLEQPQKQPHKHDPGDTADTSAIFGAWAQIEQLQRRLKEAESRAEREMRRAELAEQKAALEAAPRNFGDHDSKVEKPLLNASLVRKELQTNRTCTHGGKISSGKSTKIEDTDMPENRGYQEGESAESLETVALVPEECPSVSLNPVKSFETPPKKNHTATSNANDELLEWKKRALEAEDRLMKQDYSIFLSPQPSNTASRPPPPHQQIPPPSSAVESDLIQLKNAEIEVLRSQISRLELRIKEECQRNSEMLQAYLPHNGSQRPPLVVAEYTSSIAGGPSHEYELRMLRDEIRNLHFQLSQKNGNANTSAQSTTGSTLSSLENETEGEENEEGSGAQLSSSWGLCCVRRSKKGYGRVSR